MNARFALGVLLALSACHRSDDVTVIVPVDSAMPSAKPIDHLAKNELLEGSAKAFGLTLPRGVFVNAAFADVVYASGRVETPAAIEYVRTRVREGKMILPAFAETTTTFDHVRMPATPDKQYVIAVRPAFGAVGITQLEIRDVTPQRAPELPDEAARWRNAGLAPNGRVLDPTHLQ